MALHSQNIAMKVGTVGDEIVVNGQPQATRRSAVMHLQFSEAATYSREVALTVRDATGAILLAYVTLQQGSREAAPPACAVGQ